MFDIEKIRADFPILSEQVNGKPFVYFDSASTAQKPKRVIDSIVNFYTKQNSNIHRGVHTLSVQATERYENAREVIQHFVNASNKEEIIFTKGTTESINFVAQCFGEKLLHKNDEILLSQMEHHSNLVPWQLIAQKYQCFLKYVPITESGALNLQELSNIITSKTKLVALTHASNTLGTVNPIKHIIEIENIDVLNGTPLLDIKPFIPEFDIHKVEKIGWLENKISEIAQTKSDERFN